MYISRRVLVYYSELELEIKFSCDDDILILLIYVMMLRRAARRCLPLRQKLPSSQRQHPFSTATVSAAATPAVEHGAGRTVLGVFAGSASVVAWCAVRPDAIADLPFSGVATTLVGCGVCRLVAPQAGVLSMVGGFLFTGAATVMGGAALALHAVDRSVPLTPAEADAINADLQKYVHNHKDSTSQDIADASKTLLYASKALWHFVESQQDLPKDDHGRAVLTRGHAEAFAAETTMSAVQDAASEGRCDVSDVPTEDEQQAIRELVENRDEIILQLFSIADADNDGAVTFPEFHRAFCLFCLREADPGIRGELVFEALDVDNSGAISRDELCHFVKRLSKAGGIPAEDAVHTPWMGMARPATAEEITDKWMARFDVNHDGGISRDEFKQMLVGGIDFSPTLLTGEPNARNPPAT